MATDPVEPALMTLDRKEGSATMELYRAALGPLQTDYYLRVFNRFDAEGRAGPSWNWAAALLTLNWMLLRQLWSHALAYAGALTAALLLLLGIGRLVFGLSETSQWAVAAGVLLLATGLPGALGNAWLYGACSRRIEAALAAVASTEEACEQLSRAASTRQRLAVLAAGNMALLAACMGLVLAWPRSAALPLGTAALEAAHTATPPILQPSGLAAQSVALAAAVSAAAVPSSSPPSSPPSSPASDASAARPTEPLPPGRSRQGLVQPAAIPASPPPVAPVPPVAAASATGDRPERAAPSTKAKVPKGGKETRKAREVKASKDNQTAAPGDYMINVGLFADANNARNAYQKLIDAGLPASSQQLTSAKGQERTRVRVGPFASQAEADSAAQAIRALRLEAAVFKAQAASPPP